MARRKRTGGGPVPELARFMPADSPSDARLLRLSADEGMALPASRRASSRFQGNGHSHRSHADR